MPIDSQTSTPLAAEATLLDQVREIAERAGEVILGFYAQGDAVEVREKADHSPVTAADEAAEAVILEALAKLTPEVPVVSEEAFSQGQIPDVSRGRFWLVDPLDGTKEFISRNGEFTVNIALIEDAEPVVGVVHAPARAKSWAGQLNRGATLHEAGQAPRPVAVRKRPETGVLVAASRRHGDVAVLDAFLADYDVGDLVSAGSSIKFCLVAGGEADFYPRFGRTMEWDTAAGHAVLRAAGGRVETQDGVPLTYGKPGFENPYFIARGED